MGMEQGDRNGRTTVKDHEAAPQTSSRGKLVKAGAQASEISGKALGRMIEAFMGLPGIGKKSAQRLAFAVLGMTKEEAAGIAQAILDLKNNSRYHVLLGALSPLDGIAPRDLTINGLMERLGSGAVKEVIIATNPTVKGEATAIYLSKLIKPLGIRGTRLA